MWFNLHNDLVFLRSFNIFLVFSFFFYLVHLGLKESLNVGVILDFFKKYISNFHNKLKIRVPELKKKKERNVSHFLKHFAVGAFREFSAWDFGKFCLRSLYFCN